MRQHPIKKIPPKRDLKEGPEKAPERRSKWTTVLFGRRPYGNNRLHTYRKLVYTDRIGNATRTARKKCWTI